MGDVGTLTNGAAKFRVTDTKKLGDAHLHVGKVEVGSFRKGDIVAAQVDAATRQSTVLNHSATHLLHAALRKVLGARVADDKVSLVASVSPGVSGKVSAGVLIGQVAKIVGGRGGGRPDFAQAGGNDPSKLEDALRAVPGLIAEQLGGT